MELRSDQTVAAILTARPRAIRVFMRRGMACPGCAMSKFMTLREAAGVYGVDVRALLHEIEKETSR